jgi:hypothetical protein
MTLTQQIQAYAAEQPEGAPITAKAFLHLGNRAAIDQALARLAKRGQLMRVGRGLYVAPVQSRFGTRSPETSKLIEAFAMQTGETVVANEAASANALGLTTQVPVRQVYLTSGSSRELKLGKQVVELRHAPQWALALPNSQAGQALRAMYWAGESGAKAVVTHIKQHLAHSQLKELSFAPTRSMPEWAAREIGAMRAVYG